MVLIPKEVVYEAIRTLLKYVPKDFQETAKKETAKRMKLQLDMIENREKMVR